MNRNFKILVIAAIVSVFLVGAYAYKKYKSRPPQLTGKVAPAFTLPLLDNPKKTFSPSDMKGKVWMLNIWASWCKNCKAEHDLLMDLSKLNIVPIYGINYWDNPESGLEWLKSHGNPYVLVLDGRTEINYGIRGVPDTYVIDKDGVIQYAMNGQITTEILKNKILPLVEELEKR